MAKSVSKYGSCVVKCSASPTCRLTRFLLTKATTPVVATVAHAVSVVTVAVTVARAATVTTVAVTTAAVVLQVPVVASAVAVVPQVALTVVVRAVALRVASRFFSSEIQFQ
jgi:hypothetical protein